MHSRHYNPYKPLLKPSLSWLPFLIILGILLVGIGFLLLSPFLNIKKINVKGNASVAPEKLTAVIQQGLAEKRWGVGSQRNMLLLNKKNLEGKLKHIVTAEKITIAKQLFGKNLDITLTAPSYTALWITRGISYALNSEGKVIGLADTTNKDALRFFSNIQKIPETQEPVISPEVFAVANQIAYNTVIQSFGLDYFIVGENPAHELKMVTRKGFTIIIDPGTNLNTQLDYLSKIITQVVPGDKISSLEYIDLRFENRIFYKTR